MTSKERMQSVLEKRSVDKIPFWPKITPSYVNFQQSKWKKQTISKIHEYIGSDYLSYTGIAVEEILPRGMECVKTINGSEQITIYKVGNKQLVERSVVTKEVGDCHPVQYPIKTLEDIVAMTEYYSALSYKFTKDSLEKHRAHVENNRDKLFVFSMPESPLMDLVQFRMGIEDFSYLYYDFQKEVEALMDEMHKASLRLHELVCPVASADYFLSVENTSTTLISPQLFEKYCVGHLTDYNKVMAKSGKRQILHMCGKLKAILPHIDKIPAIAMEAFTSPTTGDTYIKDGYDMLPEKALIGGSCATTWALNNSSAIAKRILEDIAMAGGAKNLFLSTGGVIPFSATPEIIKEVWDKIQKELYGT